MAAASCDKVPLTAPSGSTVTLSSNTRIVPINGTANITATVIESAGTAVHNGTLVTFTTTVGTLDPPEARTHNGSATVRLVAGSRSGRAVIRAFSGDAASGGDESEDFVIDIGGAAAGRITLTANPSNVSSAGGTSTLTAIVFDVDGNTLPGVPVSFTTTAGSISSSVVTSDSNGQAATTITTNRDAEVTAIAGGAGTDGEAVTATATITATEVPTVTVTSSTASPSAGQPVTFSINASVTAPNSIRRLTVDYGDGRIDTFSGPVTSVAHTYQSAGTYTVTVTAEDTSGGRGTGATTIVISPNTALIALTASPTSTTVGAVVTFTVAVTGQGGQTPPAIQSITWAFGDGNGATTTSTTRSHIYSQTGNFLVTATVRFVDGSTRTGEAAVAVR